MDTLVSCQSPLVPFVTNYGDPEPYQFPDERLLSGHVREIDVQ